MRDSTAEARRGSDAQTGASIGVAERSRQTKGDVSIARVADDVESVEFDLNSQPPLPTTDHGIPVASFEVMCTAGTYCRVCLPQ